MRHTVPTVYSFYLFLNFEVFFRRSGEGFSSFTVVVLLILMKYLQVEFKDEGINHQRIHRARLCLH